jgi:N-acetyl-anhydromuramyl-L-alanine amidase AmpD
MLFGSAGVASADSMSTTRADAFASAAREFGVPEPVLLAVAYNESRWVPHGNAPSSDNGYGLMDLRTKVAAAQEDGRGDLTRPLPSLPKSTVPAASGRFTLDDAASLLQIPMDTLKNNELQNVRGGAAVLASYARQTNGGQLPGSVTDWYAAVAAYSGASDPQVAQSFADEVYDTVHSGASAITPDGQTLRITAIPAAAPNKGQLTMLNLQVQSFADNPRGGGNQRVDCPSTLNCRFIPAAYAGIDPNDPTQYGNYDPANRPNDMQIKYIIIHDTEGSYDSAINWFQTSLFATPPTYVSANYVIRSSDGAITEMVHPGDVAWQAGDWYINMHSIGIEHEGFATQGATWYTEAMYRSSATLVRYLAKKYNVPLDRQHILGHDNLPTLSGARMSTQHNDPGPYWDWNHYMDLLQAPIDHGAPVTNSTKVLTIAPQFAANQPPVTDCSVTPCATLPAQGSNLVYLHTQPNNTSPLLSDPYKHPDNAPGTTGINDWSASANAGDQFAVAGKQGDWTGVWFGGKVGWFYNPGGSSQTAHASSGRIVIPKAGLASAPVYGGAFPESSAYPAGVPNQSLVPLYAIPSGQAYVTSGKTPTDFFYDATVNYSLPHDHEIFHGNDVYYKISFNHRQVFVKAADVSVKSY